MRKTCFGLWLSRPSVAGLHMGGDIDVLYIWTMMAKLGSGIIATGQALHIVVHGLRLYSLVVHICLIGDNNLV